MEIIVARHSGFCYGVKKAYNKVEKFINEKEDSGDEVILNTYGDLVHNNQVVDFLETKGVVPIYDVNDASADTVIIRAHGVAPSVYKDIENKKLKCIDATCDFVKRIHTIVREHLETGHRIIIIGDKNHPEVMGIAGISSENTNVVSTKEDVYLLEDDGRDVCLVCQTTYRKKVFDELLEIILQKFNNVKYKNTICGATTVYQREAEQLSKEVDAMIVIGGKHSSNTKKLYEISLKNCSNTYHIEKLNEINVKKLIKCDRIGIIAGASTPEWVIKSVEAKLKFYL